MRQYPCRAICCGRECFGCEGDACVEKLARHVRAQWYVEVYHGKRDNGYHEDKLTRRMDLNIMSAIMVARSLGMWLTLVQQSPILRTHLVPALMSALGTKRSRPHCVKGTTGRRRRHREGAQDPTGRANPARPIPKAGAFYD